MKGRMRYGIVAYRDYPEAYKRAFRMQGKQFQAGDIPWHVNVMPWTADPLKVQAFMEQIQSADCAQDIAEDVAIAMLEVRVSNTSHRHHPSLTSHVCLSIAF